jgi:hypothetical protein
MKTFFLASLAVLFAASAFTQTTGTASPGGDLHFILMGVGIDLTDRDPLSNLATTFTCHRMAAGSVALS